MEFDREQDDDHDEEMELEASYDSLGNSASRVRMPSEEPEGLPTQSTTQPRQQQRKPRYRECLKNHAVGIGGHALDGCGEFMPAGADNTIDSLKCAACNCHRNFHRKETDPVGSGPRPVGHGEPYSVVPPHHYPPQPQFPQYCRTPAGYLHVAPNHRPLALPSTSFGKGSDSREREVKDDVSNPSGGGVSGSKKRHRTKFTNEQKEKMLGLAERLGWKIQKQDEVVVQQFCNETGIKRHVLKVWLHNNKNTLGKNKPEG